MNRLPEDFQSLCAVVENDLMDMAPYACRFVRTCADYSEPVSQLRKAEPRVEKWFKKIKARTKNRRPTPSPLGFWPPQYADLLKDFWHDVRAKLAVHGIPREVRWMIRVFKRDKERGWASDLWSSVLVDRRYVSLSAEAQHLVEDILTHLLKGEGDTLEDAVERLTALAQVVGFCAISSVRRDLDNQSRRQARKVAQDEAVSLRRAEKVLNDFSGSLDREEDNEILREIGEGLKPEEMSDFCRYYLNDEDIREIAADRGCSEGAMRVRLHRIRLKLLQIYWHRTGFLSEGDTSEIGTVVYRSLQRGDKTEEEIVADVCSVKPGKDMARQVVVVAVQKVLTSNGKIKRTANGKYTLSVTGR